jgi:hypothetical protein
MVCPGRSNKFPEEYSEDIVAHQPSIKSQLTAPVLAVSAAAKLKTESEQESVSLLCLGQTSLKDVIHWQGLHRTFYYASHWMIY